MRALTFILFIACFIISFLGGYDYASKHCYNVRTVTDTIIERDTITAIPDTVFRTVALGEKTVKVVIHDTLCKTDTVTVSLPFVQKQYKDSSYSAWISGYEPSLDSIRVFPKTTIIRESKVVRQKDRRWGVFGGVGIGVSDRITPCVGVGIGYRIL